MGKILEAFLEISKVLLIVVVSALMIRYFVFQPFIVEGVSMEPTYQNRDYLLVEKISYRFGDPSRGDTVVLRYPNNPQINYVKRIIGLSGETLRIAGGVVSINGETLREDYLSVGEKTMIQTNPDTPYEITIGANQFFVMGDNRDHSSDSREGWLIGRDDIVGRTIMVLYPKSDFRVIASPQY